MKALALLALFLISVNCFPMGLLKRQTGAMEYPSTMPLSSRYVRANTCRCFAAESADIVSCLPLNLNGQAPTQFSNGVYCTCFDEDILLPDTCLIPTYEECELSWWLQYYSIITFDYFNVSSFASIDGRVAAGGNIWLNNFRLNYYPGGHPMENETEEIINTACDKLELNDWRYAIVAGQNLSLVNGSVFSGDAIYGNSLWAGSDVNFSSSCGTFLNQSKFDFDFAKSEIIRISDGLMAMSANGQYTVSAGVLRLTAPATIPESGLIVFNVLITDLIVVQSLQFSGFPDSTSIRAVLFNFLLPSGLQVPANFAFSLPEAWMFDQLANTGFKNKIIFNFGSLPATLNIAVSNPTLLRNFYGTLIAYNARVNAGSTRIRFTGQVFISSFTGQYLISEYVPVHYCLQTILPMVTTTAPASTTSIPVTTMVPSVIGTTHVPVKRRL